MIKTYFLPYKMEIVSVTGLTYDLLKSLELTGYARKYMIDDFGYDENDEDQYDEELKTDDFVLMTIKDVDGKEYTLVHGYPGDNAHGLLYTDDEMYIISDGDVGPVDETGRIIDDHILIEKLNKLRYDDHPEKFQR